MSDSVTTLDLTMLPGADLLRIRVNGATVAEVFPGASLGPDALRAEVANARAAVAAVRLLGAVLGELATAGDLPDHNYKAPKDRRAAFAEGLRAGLNGETVPYPAHPGVPDVPAESTPSYTRGWNLGDAIRRAVAAAGSAT